MEEKTIDQVLRILNNIDVVEIVSSDENTIAFKYGGILTIAYLSDETPARLRFSVDVKELDEEASDEVLGELMYALLDLNTEIDPVAAAIDSTDPDHPVIQARTTLRVVDLQDEEIVSEIHGLIASLNFIVEAVEAHTATVA